MCLMELSMLSPNKDEPDWLVNNLGLLNTGSMLPWNSSSMNTLWKFDKNVYSCWCCLVDGQLWYTGGVYSVRHKGLSCTWEISQIAIRNLHHYTVCQSSAG